ncbi:MAG: hypothetical protein GY894_08900 [Planctomycetes bacterium]|nr:hypothetical protein [Planctomycetota bacterium]MCP4839460.1 hypothetical protein [Planctomycetota bacterium]
MMLRSITAVLIIGSSATAADETSEPSVDLAALGEAPLRMDMDLGAWLVRVKGEGSNGGDTLQIGDDTDNSMDLGNLTALFRGELTISKDPWAVRVMGTHGSWNGTANLAAATTWGGRALLPGVDYDSSLDMSWLAFEGHWYPITLQGDGRRDTTEPIELLFGPHLGITWLDIDQSLAGVDNGASWWTVYGGAELSLDVDLRPFTSLVHGMSVDVGGSVGGTGSNGGLFYKVRGGLTLHVTPNFGATVGYRLMEYKNLTDGDWDISPSFPGLFIGLNVSF